MGMGRLMVGGNLTATPNGGMGSVGIAGICGSPGMGMGRLMVGGNLTATPNGGMGSVGIAGICGSPGMGMGRLMVGGNGGNAQRDLISTSHQCLGW